MANRERPIEGELERWARQIVANKLRTQVDRYDDGTQDAQVDAIIRVDSELVPLEVVSDQDGQFYALWQLLSERDFLLATSPYQPSWHVTVRRNARLRGLEKFLADHLRHVAHDDDLFGYAALSGPNFEDKYLARLRLRQSFEARGVTHLAPMQGLGTVRVSVEGWNSWDDEISVVQWVHRILERHPNKAEKLHEYDSPQGHLFIWATPGRVWSVNSMLRRSDCPHPPIPQEAPALPSGVTDLWISSTMNDRDCLHWAAEQGWERFSRAQFED